MPTAMNSSVPPRQQVTQAFAAQFGSQPGIVVRAPGRVNLIGEHTDYNDGFVLPMAIDRAVWIALQPRSDRLVRVRSLDFDQTVEFSLDDFKHGNEGWAEYIKGVAWALQQAGHTLSGWEGATAGDVPIGSGLSSSAALELAAARAFAAISDVPWNPVDMALLSQKAENHWVGVNCGIMDQMISAAGQAGRALLIDCRSLDMQPAPLPPETVVVVLDTGTRRGLVDSAYNERRTQCEAAAHFFGVPALRDVSIERFAAEAGGLDDVTRRRARHIVTENARTLAAAESMNRGDAVDLGRLMAASHDSLRDDFEVSCRELDIMARLAQSGPGCFGARMTGAGFGGCAVAVVQAGLVASFADTVAGRYESETGLVPLVYITAATEGASIV